MKRLSLFLLLVLLATQFSCKIAPVLAQEQEEANKLAIQEVMKAFYESTSLDDYDSALKQISPNFSCVINGETMDYSKHEVFLKNSMERTYKRFIRFSQYNIETPNLDISGDGNKAVAVVGYDWKGFDSEDLIDKSGHTKRLVHLTKENGAWKITCIGPVTPKPQQLFQP